MSAPVTRILLAALGGEGGGVLMNWIVAAGRAAGFQVQATSVPGVAQRTGSTSYYIEAAPRGAEDRVLGLVPMAGRVDVVVSSELVETARVLSQGFVSPERTTVVSSLARQFSTAEKIAMGDGRYAADTVQTAVEEMAARSFLLDLGKLAEDNGTFVSATMFGAVAASGALPWDADVCRGVLTDDRSRAGFDAAAKAVTALMATSETAPEPASTDLPPDLARVIDLGADRTEDYQDAAYAETYRAHAARLSESADLDDHRAAHAVTEACRRLALWMAYEDIARVADLKTRPERFQRIHDEVQLAPGQLLTITEYMKPRAEEIADMLPLALARPILRRAERGGWFPFLGKGRYITSNGPLGYRMLRSVALLKHVRRRSHRYAEEQAAIETWMDAMEHALPRSPAFATALAELPRVLKGYSDTLARGKSAYGRIWEAVVEPALNSDDLEAYAKPLRDAIGAALSDDTHAALDAQLSGELAVPILKAG
ncbi:indolepyruvate oxidoreductase subunit beta family protein [Pseudaestuariivita sp.]|uniref:indolepyruvate oxidoreductase subunit beta family protein n=1 Tax=Pseudaestuariivita sp. TaxID=2211669 RepID=UPI004058683D